MSINTTIDRQLACPATLTYATANTAYQAGAARIEAGADVIDCAALAQFDSAALAVLLNWRRVAQARGVALRLQHIPAPLVSLAHAYGIEMLLGITPVKSV
jgi:phospholipid transport system transporter-binding protein